MKEIDGFLHDLRKLLEKNNAVIKRSANSSNDLVLSIRLSSGVWKELTFAEEISEVSIRNKWWCC